MRRAPLIAILLATLACSPKPGGGGSGRTGGGGHPDAAKQAAALQRHGAALGHIREDLAVAAIRQDPDAARQALSALDATVPDFQTALDGVGATLARMPPAVMDRQAQYVAAHQTATRRLREAARALAEATTPEERGVTAGVLLDALRSGPSGGPERSLQTRHARRTPPRMKAGLAPDLDAVRAPTEVVPMDTAATAQFPADAPEIRALVGGVRTAPEVAAHIREAIALAPHHGLAGGAVGCARTRVCSAADAAALLVAGLRGADIPARVRYGTLFIDAATIPLWLGSATPRAAQQQLALAGIPVAATEDGLFLEHFWVAARVADRWVDLDPTFPPRAQAAPRVMAGRSRPLTFFKTYLGDARDRTPAAYLQGAPTGAPRTAMPRIRRVWALDLSAVPNAYVSKLWLGLAGEDASIEIPVAAALATGVWLQPDAEPDTDRLARHFAPAPIPAYLTRTSFRVVADGRLWGRLPEAVPGRALRLEVTLPAGGGTPVVVDSPISAGAAAALTVIFHPPGLGLARSRWAIAEAAPPADQGVARLAAAGAVLFAALTHEAGIHAQAADGIAAIGPSAAVTSTGLRPVQALAPDPLAVADDGIRLDVARMDQVLIGNGRAADAPGFAARAGAALSAWEARALEIAYGLPSVSAVGAIKVSSAQAAPLRLDRTGLKRVAALPLSARGIAEIREALAGGRIVFVAPRPVRRAAWAGETYVLVDPASGQGAFIVRGALDGAVTADPATALVDATNAGHALPARTEDQRRVGRAAAAYEGWPDVWTGGVPSGWITGVDALLAHAQDLAGQAPAAPVALPADPGSLAPGTIVDLGTRGRGVALGEIDTRLDASVARHIAGSGAAVPGLDPKTRRYSGAAVLVSVAEPGGTRRIVALPAALLR